MNPQSLGYRTDLFFPKFDGYVIDRSGYSVILTPMNPTYYWGNFLLFPAPPKAGDLARWKALFSEEIGSRIPAKHFAFGWDTTQGEQGEVRAFLEEGFHLNQSAVLTATQVRLPPKNNAEVEFRPLADDSDWEQATQNQVACRPEGHAQAAYRIFKQDQMRRYRRMTQAGWGCWFGAFLSRQLVADLGVFVVDGIGRFQHVGTHPDFRRRGICGSLVYQASQFAFGQLRADLLVIAAEENYHAGTIYQSVGFQPKERQVGLDWWPPSEG
jgi:ribosomal protein S18 acetylase RimI-like enzyme